MSDNPIQDYIVIKVPSDTILNPESILKFNSMAKRCIVDQYKKPPYPSLILMHDTEWLMPKDWEEVIVFQPHHQCPTCLAANDQAVAYLKEFPEKKLILGNLSYSVFW